MHLLVSPCPMFILLLVWATSKPVIVFVLCWCTITYDLTDFQRGQIVVAQLVGAYITMVANLVGISWATISTVIRAYKVHGKTISAKHNSGRKTKLTDGDRRVLRKIAASQSNTTATKVTTKLNVHSENAVSMKKSAGKCINKIYMNWVRWLCGNAWDSYLGGPGFKSHGRPTWMRFLVVSSI